MEREGLDRTQGRGRRASLWGSLLSLLVGIMFVLVISFFLFDYRTGNERQSHSYSISIDVNDDEMYEILCPVPVTSGGMVRQTFAEDVKVMNGEVSIDVETTAHGRALRIVGYGAANISWNDHWSGTSGRLTNLSMPVLQGIGGSNLTWVYCDHGAVSISLRSFSSQTILDQFPRSNSITRTITGTLGSEGWQQMLIQTSRFSGI